MIRGAIKNKLSTCSLRWDPSDICTKTWTSCLNQTCQSENSFTAFVLMTDSSTWTVSESKRTSVYCIQCRQDISSDCNFKLSDWIPVSGACGEKMTIRRCLALEAVICKWPRPDDVTFHLGSKTSCFLRPGIPAPWVFSPPLESCSNIYAGPTSCLIITLIFNVLFLWYFPIFFYLSSLSIYSRSANIRPVHSNWALSSLYLYKTRPLTADWLQVCFGKKVFFKYCLVRL